MLLREQQSPSPKLVLTWLSSVSLNRTEGRVGIDPQSLGAFTQGCSKASCLFHLLQTCQENQSFRNIQLEAMSADWNLQED